MTTWVISGFSLDPLHGLGLPTGPRKIKVSKPFAVTCDLPHSVQRGEVVSVPVVIHNYMNKDITTEVTIHNEHTMFEFADVTNSKGGKSKFRYLTAGLLIIKMSSFRNRTIQTKKVRCKKK